MNLNNFEHYIDGIIYIRGRDYFDNGYVDFVKETEKNVFVARVEGTKPYEVDVKLDEKQNIIGTFCDCPYDMGEYCKHQVAVFLALKDMKNQTSDEGQKKKILGDPDIRQVLFERTKEEIIDFLNEIASENDEIKQRIIIEFYEADDDEQEISQAVSLIHTYIRSHSDQYGYINYRNTGGAVHGAELVFEKARDAFDEGMGIHAVNLALCVVRDMVDLIQDADDSNGTIGGVIDNAFNLIDEVVHNVEFNESQKRTVFDCLMKEASQNRYDGWTD